MSQEFNRNFPSVEYLRKKAKQRIPGFVFDYLDGGCNEEVNLRKNTNDLRDVELVPKYLIDWKGTTLNTTLFGNTYNYPFGIAPIGLQGLVWPGAPEILAKAAFENNIPYILSTVSTASIEKIADITQGNAWFQLYHPAESTITDDLISRAQSSGYQTLVILCDVPSFGYRNKEIKNGLSLPAKMTVKNILQIAGKPGWAVNTLLHGTPEFATLKKYIPKGTNMHHLGLFMNKIFNGRLNSDKISRLRDKWKGKLILKGVASEEDAELSLKLGVDGLIVSNHGGRQLDAGESGIKSLKRVVDVVGNKTTVMMDSGVRSGADVARAIACGAQFVFMGRTFMYGVAALGKNGGNHTIEILRKQLQQVMEQLSCSNVQELSSRLSK